MSIKNSYSSDKTEEKIIDSSHPIPISQSPKALYCSRDYFSYSKQHPLDFPPKTYFDLCDCIPYYYKYHLTDGPSRNPNRIISRREYTPTPYLTPNTKSRGNLEDFQNFLERASSHVELSVKLYSYLKVGDVVTMMYTCSVYNIEVTADRFHQKIQGRIVSISPGRTAYDIQLLSIPDLPWVVDNNNNLVYSRDSTRVEKYKYKYNSEDNIQKNVSSLRKIPFLNGDTVKLQMLAQTYCNQAVINCFKGTSSQTIVAYPAMLLVSKSDLPDASPIEVNRHVIFNELVMDVSLCLIPRRDCTFLMGTVSSNSSVFQSFVNNPLFDYHLFGSILSMVKEHF